MIFHWEFYINKYDDLNAINNEKDALNHWLKHGKKEQRIYNDISILFEWKDYLVNNDDLRKNIFNEEDAWKHFLYYGNKENRKIKHKSFLKNYCV